MTQEGEALKLLRALQIIALNGTVCTPPDTYSDPLFGGDGTGRLFDIEALKCEECRPFWRRVHALLASA